AIARPSWKEGEGKIVKTGQPQAGGARKEDRVARRPRNAIEHSSVNETLVGLALDRLTGRAVQLLAKW
ncbi:MAG: hypothetical protein MI861_05510, partial [Pirellulales bacterium]|nr:hypothetical protein [Pirellulales bacterium]